MKLEKPQWQIDAEQDLETWKDTALIKLSAARAEALYGSFKCNTCGKSFNKIGLKEHQRKCLDVIKKHKLIIDLHNSELRPGVAEISKITGINIQTVFNFFLENNLQNWDTHRSDLTKQKIIEYYFNGENISSTDIAIKLEISSVWVNQILKENDLKPWTTIETDSNNELVLNLYHDGAKKSIQEISAVTGINEGTILKILTKNKLKPWSFYKRSEEESKVNSLLLKDPDLQSTDVNNEFPEISTKQAKRIIERIKKRNQ